MAVQQHVGGGQVLRRLCAIAIHPARDGVRCETLKTGLSGSGSIQRENYKVLVMGLYFRDDIVWLGLGNLSTVRLGNSKRWVLIAAHRYASRNWYP